MTPSQKQKPEMSLGPYPGGLRVNVWLNWPKTSDSVKAIRSASISPPRYLDPKDGKWKDSTSYRPADLRMLITALQQALRYMDETPLPPQSATESTVPVDAGFDGGEHAEI